MKPEDLFNLPSNKVRDLELGEEFAAKAKEYGALAAKFLFRGQWSYKEPEWFDHRLHLLDPENQFNDFWTVSAANVIQVLPLDGTLLDLCSGDGFYDYHFYRHRAYIVGIEKDSEALALAHKHHESSRIVYVMADVLGYMPLPEAYDAVLIRGAIEHFKAEDQLRILKIAHYGLKPGGYFCGDTVAYDRPGEGKLHGVHEYEWRTEDEMRGVLANTFSNIETWTLKSHNRTTLFWRCKK